VEVFIKANVKQKMEADCGKLAARWYHFACRNQVRQRGQSTDTVYGKGTGNDTGIEQLPKDDGPRVDTFAQEDDESGIGRKT
jgi:hypothetical protein